MKISVQGLLTEGSVGAANWRGGDQRWDLGPCRGVSGSVRLLDGVLAAIAGELESLLLKSFHWEQGSLLADGESFFLDDGAVALELGKAPFGVLGECSCAEATLRSITLQGPPGRATAALSLGPTRIESLEAATRLSVEEATVSHLTCELAAERLRIELPTLIASGIQGSLEGGGIFHVAIGKVHIPRLRVNRDGREWELEECLVEGLSLHHRERQWQLELRSFKAAVLRMSGAIAVDSGSVAPTRPTEPHDTILEPKVVALLEAWGPLLDLLELSLRLPVEGRLSLPLTGVLQPEFELALDVQRGELDLSDLKRGLGCLLATVVDLEISDEGLLVELDPLPWFTWDNRQLAVCPLSPAEIKRARSTGKVRLASLRGLALAADVRKALSPHTASPPLVSALRLGPFEADGMVEAGTLERLSQTQFTLGNDERPGISGLIVRGEGTLSRSPNNLDLQLEAETGTVHATELSGSFRTDSATLQVSATLATIGTTATALHLDTETPSGIACRWGQLQVDRFRIASQSVE